MNITQILVLVFSVLQSPFLWPSAPAQPIKFKRTDPLELRFKKADIQALGWKGQVLNKVDKSQNKIQIERKGFGKLPTQLMIIPRNSRLKPYLLNVELESQQVTLSPTWEKLSQNEVFIWGETPSGVCHQGNSSVSLVVSRPRKAQSFSGAFLVSLKTNSPSSWIHLYNSHGKITEVEGALFKSADEMTRAACHIYYGGPCDQVFTLRPESKGKHHEVKISKIKKSEVPCPI